MTIENGPTPSSRTSIRARRLVAAIAIPVLFFLSLAAWAFASPVGATPDDDFHLPSIWCGLGERPGLCEASGDPSTRLVPSSLTTSTCYAFRADLSADCWDAGATGMAETPRVNVGLYPPLYYGTMSVFASPDVQVSTLVIRLVNAAVAVGVLTAVFWSLPRRLRPALVISAVAAAVPLGLFIIPSTNPSTWAYVSAATVWVSLYGALITDGRRRWVLSALAVLGAIMGAGARADAAAFAVFGVVIAAVLGARLRRGVLIPAIAGVVVLGSAVGFYLSAGQGDAIVSGLADSNPPLTLSEHVANLLNVPSLWVGALGGWPLGWLDTSLPALVSTLSVAVACGVLFIGIRTFSARRALALGGALAAMWVVPFVLLAQSRAVIGESVQPRYILPLIVIMLGVASASPRAAHWWAGPRAAVAASALTVAAAFALHVNIRRYTTGTTDQAVDPGENAQWWWNGIPAPLAVWVVGSLAFALAVGLLCVALQSSDVAEHGRRRVFVDEFPDIANLTELEPTTTRTRLRRRRAQSPSSE